MTFFPESWSLAVEPMSLPEALFSFGLQIGDAILLSALLYRFFEAPCTRVREKAGPAVARVFASEKRATSGQ
jgi:peptidoglycan/LPS O-acetylase OafA/YrhL